MAANMGESIRLYVINCICGCIGKCFFSYWSANSSERSAQIAKLAYDRSAGNIQAQVDVKAVTSRLNELPKEKLIPVIENGTVFVTANLKSVEDLKSLNHVLIVENVGSEPVDTIRVETRVLSANVILPKGVEPKEGEIRHIVVKQANVLDYNLNTKLQSKGTAHISIIRNVLEAILDTQNPKQLNRDQTAMIQISCYGKLVGSPSFDAAPRQANAYITLYWDPSGFNQEINRKLLSEYLAVPIVKNPK